MASNKITVEALLFDVFGTVVDWRKSITEVLVAAAQDKTQESQAHANTLSKIDWGNFAQDWRNYYKKETSARGKDPSIPKITVDQIHEDGLHSLLDKNGLKDIWSEEEIKQLSMSWHHLVGWRDTVDGLYRLKKKFILSTLSNGDVRLLIDMAKHADLPWDLVLSSELLGYFKPQPKTYLGACEYLKLKPSNVAMVAAHLYDLKGAKESGLKTIYIRRKGEEDENEDEYKEYLDLVFDNFHEAAEYFDIPRS